MVMPWALSVDASWLKAWWLRHGGTISYRLDISTVQCLFAHFVLLLLRYAMLVGCPMRIHSYAWGSAACLAKASATSLPLTALATRADKTVPGAEGRATNHACSSSPSGLAKDWTSRRRAQQRNPQVSRSSEGQLTQGPDRRDALPRFRVNPIC